MLQSISNGNMFRDMSGLAATIGLAQAGLNATSAAAGRAASQAGANMATFAEYQVEMVKTLLPLIGAAMGVPLSPNTSPTNISNDGAKINQGAKMDQKKAPATGGSGSGGTDAPSGGFAGGTGKGGNTGGTSPSPAASPIPSLGSSSSHEVDAFQSSLGGNGGPAMLGLLSGILQTILSATPQAGSTNETKPELKLGDKVPNKNEAEAVGAIDKKIKRDTPEFDALVKNENTDIVFKDEEGTDADRLMTPRMKEKLDDLAVLVIKEWPELKLRVTEVWDEDNEHSSTSTHYEGRGADLTISDRDGKKLGRLAQLAVDAGFDWVFYEDSSHVHASVKKENVE